MVKAILIRPHERRNYPMNREVYEAAEMNVVRFDAEDVITTSINTELEDDIFD